MNLVVSAKAVLLIALVSSSGCASERALNDTDIFDLEEAIRRMESRFPFPLLPPESLPEAMPIPDINLEFDSDLLRGRLALEDSIIFGLDGLSIDSDLSVDYSEELIVKLNHVTVTVDSLMLSTTHDTDFILEYAPLILGHFSGDGEMNITINDLLVELEVWLRIKSDTHIVAEVKSFGLDVNELLFGAENFTVILNEVDFPPNMLLDFIKLLLPGVYPELEPMLLNLLSDLLSGLLENCSLTELLGLDLSCTGLFPAPPTESPATTQRHTPPPSSGSRSIWTSWNASNVLYIISIVISLRPLTVFSAPKVSS